MVKVKLSEASSAQKVPLLIISITLLIGILILQLQQSPILVALGESSTNALASPFLKRAFADHGQEITLTLYNSSFGSLTSGGGNQVSVFVSYELNDNSIAGRIINAVMEVYAPNGTLVRMSSYPNGFVAHSSGGVEGLETTIKDPTVKSVNAYVTLRNLDKTETLSNELRVDLNLNLAEASAGPTSTGEDDGGGEQAPGFELEQDTIPPVQTGHEDGDGTEETGEDQEGENENESDEELPLPLFGNE